MLLSRSGVVADAENVFVHDRNPTAGRWRSDLDHPQGSHANPAALVTVAGYSFHEAQVANCRQNSVEKMGRSP